MSSIVGGASLDAFPAYFPLAGQTVIVAGTGEAAEAKARLFAGSPARLVRVEGEAALRPDTYGGARLVFIADADEDFARAAAAAARAAGVLVNVVDRPELCDFTTPAVIDRGEVVAAVGTGGASPILAALLRNDIEQQIPEGAGRVAALFRQFQGEVRGRFPDLPARRAFLRDALSGAAAQAALAGEMDRAEALFRDSIARGHEALGRVQFMQGQGPADLLTVRASRTLAAADVLVADDDADPAILAMARRDAERLAPVDASGERLAELARSGLRVVRVGRLEALEAEALALVGLGVTVEVLEAAHRP
jgi:precorrin-2 dehydrogenase/sirohydrochlorin ferrochelatase